MSRLKSLLYATGLALSLVVSPQAAAHKVNLFAYAEGMDVFVEGYFVDGKAAQNSAVKVFNPADELLAEGITDGEGQYQFSLSQVSDLKVVLNAGMGHQATFTLSSDELGLGGAANAASNSGDSSAGESAPASSAEPKPKQLASGAVDIEALVYKAVNEANIPLVRELSASQEKASLSGIVGGVGYIVGFLGLFAYFKARQMIKEAK